MKAGRRTAKFLVPLLALTFASAFPAVSLAQYEKAEQDLRITLGGFVQEHPERGKLAGVCGTDSTRNVMNCDIHNGLLDWTVTEINLAVAWSPYGDDDKRYYRVRVSIEPLKTESMSVRLGLQLPSDNVIKGKTFRGWKFQIMSARGYRSK